MTSELATAEAADDPGTITFSDDQEVFRFGLELLLDGLRQTRRDIGADAATPDGDRRGTFTDRNDYVKICAVTSHRPRAPS